MKRFYKIKTVRLKVASTATQTQPEVVVE